MSGGELVTTAGLLVGIGWVGRKGFGPPLDRLGSEFNEVSEQRGVTFKRILYNADAKLGDDANEDEPVHPRIVRDVVEHGTWNDDDISVEYFGGVLASAKTKVGRDDRATPVLSALSRLSTYQMRTHYICYSVIRKLFEGTDLHLSNTPGRRRARAYIPASVYLAAMEFTGGEAKSITSIINHVLFGLGKEYLIEQSFKFGSVRHLIEKDFEPKEPGFVFGPTGFGIEMFLRAHGHANLGLNALLDKTIAFKTGATIPIQEGFRSVAR